MTFELISTIGPEALSGDSVQHFVPMRDGVKLATDVYLPGTGGVHGAILVRTPYDKASTYTGLKHEARFFTERGYAFVAQDVRGKYRSEGVTMPYEYDIDDGYDTVEWVVSQPWSNGRVGMMGASYYGYTVWAAVASGHPAVKAAVPQVTALSMPAMHMSSDWKNVVPDLLSINDLAQIWTDNNCYLAEIDYSVRPTIKAAEAAEEVLGHSLGVSGMVERARRSESYDPFGNRHPYDVSNIPVMHMVSWFDPGLAPGGMADFRHFQADPAQAGQHWLRAHSCDHGNYLLSDVGAGASRDPYHDDATREEIQSFNAGQIADFFDLFVAEEPQNTQVPPRVRWHLGHVGWNESESWPPPGVVEHSYELTAGHDEPRRGLLAAEGTEPTAAAAVIGWVHDPENPVPSDTSIENIWLYLANYPDIRDRIERSDVLTFTTPALETPLDVTGRPRLAATFESTGPTMHLFAVLEDVEPDGTTRPVSHGRVHVQRGELGRELMLDLDDVSYRFREGHRIQLQITSSDSQWYVVHPGTEENPWLAEFAVPNNQSLWVGGENPPSLSLPVFPGA